jgi:N utilization substance protein A
MRKVGSPHFSAYKGLSERKIVGESLGMKNEFTLAFNEVLEEKQLPKDVILRAIESAMVSAYRRAVNASNAQHVEAKIDPETGAMEIFAEKEVVEVVQDERTEVSLESARKVDENAQVGMMVIVETTPKDFGRVAAQTARQVIQQRIRDAERQAQLDFFEKQMGEIISGVVQAVNSQAVTLGLDMKAEGIMPRKEMIPGERFRVHDRVRALVLEIKREATRTPQIILSRGHRNFLRRLLENEVPEIYHGIVEIRSIAREPGERAKVAVAATQSGIDPVGACVGIRGVRIQAIVRELHDEKIDVIEWNPDPVAYIAKAISPARVSGVYLNERLGGLKTATVVVPEDQLSLAIGRDGQNARLAAKLTGWRIDIKSLSEAALDVYQRVTTDPAMAAISEAEAAKLPEIDKLLAKKGEGRPLTPEEYDMLAKFVDRIERGVSSQQKAEKKVEDARVEAARAAIPAETFEMPLDGAGLSDHVYYTLLEAGYETVGSLLLQLKLDSDNILKLQGIGPKAMQEISALEERFAMPESEPVSETTVEAVVEAEPEAIVTESIVEPAVIEEAVIETVETKEEAAVSSGIEESVVEAVAGEGEVAEGEIEEESESKLSLEELFALSPDALRTEEVVEDEDDDDLKKKDKKKKKKHVAVEYDPDRDITLVRRKHKRGDGGWEEW